MLINLKWTKSTNFFFSDGLVQRSRDIRVGIHYNSYIEFLET